MPDLERLCNQVYSLNIRNKKQAIYFEDLNTKHMKLLHSLTKHLSRAYQHLATLRDGLSLPPGRLDLLLHTLLPDIPTLLAPFSSVVKVSLSKDKKEVFTCNMPERGTAATRKRIEAELMGYLREQQERLGDQRIQFFHGVQQFQLEVPEELVAKEKKPRDYEFSSKKAGYQRFLSEFIREKVVEKEA